MTSTSTAEHRIEEQILETVRKSQGLVIEALQAWTAAIQSVTSAFPTVDLPYTDKLPKPEALVNGAYDFAERFLANQRDFAKEVLEVTASR
jgi:hypothetical protein